MKNEELDPLRVAEEKAAEMLVSFVKSGRSLLNEEEVKAVEECFEVSHCNEGKFPDIGRRCECWSLLRYCIRPCDRSELRRIETALLEVAIPGSSRFHQSVFK